MKKSRNAVRKTKNITKRKKLKELLLIAIGFKKPERYVVSKCGRLRVDKERGVVEPNWDNKQVIDAMSRNIKSLMDWVERQNSKRRKDDK